MATEPTRFVLSGGLRLAVYERGRRDAPVVLLVHGYPDNASVFDGVAELLAQRFRVVSYDVRGMGASEAPPFRHGYALPALVADLAAVAEQVTDAPVHLVGHDWGSTQAWQAVTEPRLSTHFASFTTISGPCVAHVGAWLRAERLRALPQLLRSWYMAAFQVPVVPELVMGSAPVRSLLRARLRDAVHGIELYRENVFAAHDGQRRTEVPVQQLVLTRDRFVRAGMLRAADPWCARLYRRRLSAGHWAPRDRPEQVAAMVAEFIDYLGGSARPIDLERAA